MIQLLILIIINILMFFINMWNNNIFTIILSAILLLCLVLKIIQQFLLKKEKNIFKIGLICYDTQYLQLKELLSEKNIQVTRISEDGKNKIEKLCKYVQQILSVDCIYYGYGVYFFPLKVIIAKLLNKKVVMHWIGTDILEFKKSKYKIIIRKFVDIHLACSKRIVEELEEYKIKANNIPIVPLNMNFNLSKTPKQHAALFYLPTNREEFYGIKYLYNLAKKFIDIKFFVVGNEKIEFKEKNIINLGKLTLDQMDELYNNISILIRIPKHDGLSIMLLEALMRGKFVLYCYDFPFAYKADSIESATTYFSKIIKQKPTVNKGSREYVLKNYNINTIKEKLIKVLEEKFNLK